MAKRCLVSTVVGSVAGPVVAALLGGLLVAIGGVAIGVTAAPAGAVPDAPVGSLRTAAGDVPLVGDWNGDGKDSIGVFRAGTFHLLDSLDPGAQVRSFVFGSPGDIPLTGDWNNDGIDTVGVWNNGRFYLTNGLSSTAVPDRTVLMGVPDDLPLVGDWNGDGFDTPGVRRGGFSHLSDAATGPATVDYFMHFGDPGFTPVVGDWDGNGTDTVGLRSGITFYLPATNATGTAVPIVRPYGGADMVPLAGNFDGVGGDGIAARWRSLFFLNDNPATSAVANAAVAYGNDTVVEPLRAPVLNVATFATGLSNPWDLAFTTDGVVLITERPGRLVARLPNGAIQPVALDTSDLLVAGETGLLGIEVDPAFATNRRFYTCQGQAGPEVQVIAWTVDAAYTRATRVNDPLVGGLPSSGGRHGGCRLRVGTDGALWIGTGDAAVGTVPQSLTSLGGKVLRVDRFTGAAPVDNPFLDGDRRIYSFGHRNVQGLAVRPGYGEVWTTEHGPDRDDEVNRIWAGVNYGWNPVPGYNEAVAMTDLARYPSAAPARWSSGVPTLAVAGADFLSGSQWRAWDGALAMATLKNATLRVFSLDIDGRVVNQAIPAELALGFGRLRSARQGPDGALYVTTDQGNGQAVVLRVVPS